MQNGTLRAPRERLGKQRFAGAGRPDKQDIRFLKLDVGASFGKLEAFVMLINRDRKAFLRLVLPDHIFIQKTLDLLRLRQRGPRRDRRRLLVIIDDLVADVDALIANINARAGDQLSDVVLRFAAKGAGKKFFGCGIRHEVGDISARGQCSESVRPFSVSITATTSPGVRSLRRSGHILWPDRRQDAVAFDVFLDLIERLSAVMREDP